MSNESDYTVRSGNVFADLAMAEPEEVLAKAKLAHTIGKIIGEKGWTQAQAADALGIDQPKASALVRGRLGGFSTERLFRLLNALDHNVEITVTPKAPSQLRGSLVVVGAPDSAPSADELLMRIRPNQLIRRLSDHVTGHPDAPAFSLNRSPPLMHVNEARLNTCRRISSTGRGRGGGMTSARSTAL